MSEELTPIQKVQAEYNKVVGLLGHNLAQTLNLQAERERLEATVKKIMHKATNIPKNKTEAVKETEETKPEETVEAKDETDG